MRAAQYVRMSTEHQQYSIVNQMEAITEYATLHGFEIVRTYSDEARSGIDLKGRPGLRRLLDDVMTCSADFQAILVYDISRWGRFQDTDEAAHWEFVCKQAGVNVRYCAEPFVNDGTVASALLKALKRSMASEYLRDLSAKVFAGQCNLARRGYKLGGPAGYGLRRLLLNTDGKPKMALERGERKSLTTERVTYMAGPRAEVRIVRKIYRLFLETGLNCNQIAAYLNDRKIPRDGGLPWFGYFVQRILSHPKYVGCVVYNQASTRLHSKKKRNPRSEWIVTCECFEPLIPKSRFDKAQEKLRTRVFMRSDEQLLAELSAYVEKHGRATHQMLRTDRHMATGLAYAGRFGSLSRALDKVRREPKNGFTVVELRARLRRSLYDEFSEILTANNLPSEQHKCVFSISGQAPILIEVAQCVKTRTAQLRWRVRYPVANRTEKLACLALRLYPDNRSRMDYVFFPALPPARQRIDFSEERIRDTAVVRQNLADIAQVIIGQ